MKQIRHAKKYVRTNKQTKVISNNFETLKNNNEINNTREKICTH